jgi:hypothetical protein
MLQQRSAGIGAQHPHLACAGEPTARSITGRRPRSWLALMRLLCLLIPPLRAPMSWRGSALLMAAHYPLVHESLAEGARSRRAEAEDAKEAADGSHHVPRAAPTPQLTRSLAIGAKDAHAHAHGVAVRARRTHPLPRPPLNRVSAAAASAGQVDVEARSVRVYVERR